MSEPLEEFDIYGPLSAEDRAGELRTVANLRSRVENPDDIQDFIEWLSDHPELIIMDISDGFKYSSNNDHYQGADSEIVLKLYLDYLTEFANDIETTTQADPIEEKARELLSNSSRSAPETQTAE